jgi:PilZ domain
MYSTQKSVCREKPRIKVSFPARLRTVGTTSEVLEMDGQVENVSGGGLYLRLPHSLGQNTKVNVVFRFSHVSDATTPAARVAVRGVVLRADPLPDGSCGVALAFRRYRFF